MRKIPIDNKTISKMQENRDLYADMVKKYGEDAVHNNYEVDYVLLTEGEQIPGTDTITGQLKIIDIDRELIKKVYEETKTHWYDYLTNPINLLKSWFRQDGEGLGYIPIITNHKQTAENEYGWILGNSLKIEEKDGVMVLIAKGLLIAPVAKWNHVIGLWRKISPTFGKLTPRITEVSYVVINAQVTNTSMSSGDISLIENVAEIPNQSNNLEIFFKELREAKTKAEQEVIDQKATFHRAKCEKIVDNMFQKAIISSGQKQHICDQLVSLSNGDVEKNAAIMVTNVIATKRSPFLSKPKILYIQGKGQMKTNEEIYLAYVESHRAKFNTEEEFMHSFDTHLQQVRSQESVSLSSGDITDPKQSLLNSIELVKKANLENDPELKESVATALGLSLSSGEGKGETQTAGCVETANNTKLEDGDTSMNSGDGKSQELYKEMLEKGVEALRSEHKTLMEENKQLKEQLQRIEDSIKGGK